MAKVTIRIHSDVDDCGATALNSISLIADALEDYCAYILGDQRKMKVFHQKMLRNAAQLLDVIVKMPDNHNELPYDGIEQLTAVTRESNN